MPRQTESDPRQQRLAAKLRENLRRRKKQADARKPERQQEVPDQSGTTSKQ